MKRSAAEQSRSTHTARMKPSVAASAAASTCTPSVQPLTMTIRIAQPIAAAIEMRSHRFRDRTRAWRYGSIARP
jgi:hypothetical protein